MFRVKCRKCNQEKQSHWCDGCKGITRTKDILENPTIGDMKALVHMDNAFDIKVTLPEHFMGEATLEEIANNHHRLWWLIIRLPGGQFWRIQSDGLIAVVKDYRPVTPDDLVWACEHE